MRYARIALGVATGAALAVVTIVVSLPAPTGPVAPRRDALVLEFLASMPPEEAYLRPIDRERVRTGRLEGLCTDPTKIFDGSNLVVPIPTDQCVRMTEPQHMRGVWVDAYEGSEFYPNAKKRPLRPSLEEWRSWSRARHETERKKSIWLNTGRVTLAPFKPIAGGKAYLLEFIGRKTRYSGMYGHMGMSGHEIIVDKVISIKPIDER